MPSVERLLAETEQGAAYSDLPEHYAGACKVTCNGRSQTVVVFPTPVDAEHAARFAISVLGGYHTARVAPAPGQPSTHARWQLWAMGA